MGSGQNFRANLGTIWELMDLRENTTLRMLRQSKAAPTTTTDRRGPGNIHGFVLDGKSYRQG